MVLCKLIVDIDNNVSIQNIQLAQENSGWKRRLLTQFGEWIKGSETQTHFT